jgi:hypothetical protein
VIAARKCSDWLFNLVLLQSKLTAVELIPNPPAPRTQTKCSVDVVENAISCTLNAYAMLAFHRRFHNMPPKAPPQTERQRVSRACDFCHQRGLRCRRDKTSNVCRNCTDYAVECTSSRPTRKRGRRPTTSVVKKNGNHDPPTSLHARHLTQRLLTTTAIPCISASVWPPSSSRRDTLLTSAQLSFPP